MPTILDTERIAKLERAVKAALWLRSTFVVLAPAATHMGVALPDVERFDAVIKELSVNARR